MHINISNTPFKERPLIKMAKDKKTFIGYVEWIHTFNSLEDEEAGKLIKHLLKYVNDENPEPENKIIKVVFEPIKQRLKSDLKSWEKTSQSRALTGSLGGLAKAKFGKQKKQKLAILPDNDNVLHKEIYKDKFDYFRQSYPGKKNGLNSEFENFCKKNQNWIQCVELLMPALTKEIDNRIHREEFGKFNPEWKNLQTWINKRCWEQEHESLPTSPEQIKNHPKYNKNLQYAIENADKNLIPLNTQQIEYKQITGQ